MGSPPLPQPEGERVIAVRRVLQRMVWGFLRGVLEREFQKKRRPAGRRQRRVRVRLVWVALRAVVTGLMDVMVLMVAMAFWVVALRVMFEGRREQVAYWPGLIGVQLRMTLPV